MVTVGWAGVAVRRGPPPGWLPDGGRTSWPTTRPRWPRHTRGTKKRTAWCPHVSVTHPTANVLNGQATGPGRDPCGGRAERKESLALLLGLATLGYGGAPVFMLEADLGRAAFG